MITYTYLLLQLSIYMACINIHTHGVPAKKNITNLEVNINPNIYKDKLLFKLKTINLYKNPMYYEQINILTVTYIKFNDKADQKRVSFDKNILTLSNIQIYMIDINLADIYTFNYKDIYEFILALINNKVKSTLIKTEYSIDLLIKIDDSLNLGKINDFKNKNRKKTILLASKKVIRMYNNSFTEVYNVPFVFPLTLRNNLKSKKKYTLDIEFHSLTDYDFWSIRWHNFLRLLSDSNIRNHHINQAGINLCFDNPRRRISDYLFKKILHLQSLHVLFDSWISRNSASRAVKTPIYGNPKNTTKIKITGNIDNSEMYYDTTYAKRSLCKDKKTGPSTPHVHTNIDEPTDRVPSFVGEQQTNSNENDTIDKEINMVSASHLSEVKNNEVPKKVYTSYDRDSWLIDDKQKSDVGIIISKNNDAYGKGDVKVTYVATREATEPNRINIGHQSSIVIHDKNYIIHSDIENALDLIDRNTLGVDKKHKLIYVIVGVAYFFLLQ